MLGRRGQKQRAAKIQVWRRVVLQGRELALAHRAAGLGALATRFDAILHIADGFARIGAGITNFGAFGANMWVMIRLAQHEIGAGNTDLRAIHHQLEVLGFKVLAARI